MSKRMNWDQLKLSSKRKLSTKDEAEYRDADAAARFLNRVEQKAQRADAVKASGTPATKPARSRR